MDKIWVYLYSNFVTKPAVQEYLNKNCGLVAEKHEICGAKNGSLKCFICKFIDLVILLFFTKDSITSVSHSTITLVANCTQTMFPKADPTSCDHL